MNSKGHTKAARLVNTATGGVFDQTLLELGAVDPDKNESGFSYTGKEAKHHHDDQPEGLGRTHDERDITEVVSAHCLEARRYWLDGKLQAASFEFGVATHYLLDGLICSPSIDVNRHAEGDRLFTLAFLGYVPAEIAPLDRSGYGRAFVQSQLDSLQSYWGKTDLASVDEAYAALVHLARAIAAPSVLAETQTRREVILETQTAKTVAAWAELENGLAQAKPAYEQALRESLGSLTKGRAMTLGVFAVSREVSRTTTAGLFRRLVSWVEPLFTWPLRLKWNACLRPVVGAEVAKTQRAQTEAEQALRKCDSAVDATWYPAGAGASSGPEAAAAIVLPQEQKRQAAYAQAETFYKKTKAAYAKAYVKRLWPESVPDRIGRFFEENPGYKFIALGLVFLLATCTALVAVSVKSVGAFVVFALVAGAGVFALKAISCWQEVSITFWKRVPFVCPKCKTDQELWVHLEETEATCSSCGQGVYLGTAHHEL